MSLTYTSARKPALRRTALRRNFYAFSAHNHLRGMHGCERTFRPKMLKPGIDEIDEMDKRRGWWHTHAEETVLRIEPAWKLSTVEVNKMTDERLNTIAHELSKIVKGRVSTSMLEQSRHESLLLREARKSGDTDEDS